MDRCGNGFDVPSRPTQLHLGFTDQPLIWRVPRSLGAPLSGDVPRIPEAQRGWRQRQDLLMWAEETTGPLSLFDAGAMLRFPENPEVR